MNLLGVIQMKISAKKVVLFLVEGIYDETALYGIMETIINQNSTVKFHTLNGDITTRNCINETNVIAKINKFVSTYIDKENTFNAKDIHEIIHIIDTDGAFIPASSVEINNETQSNIYTERKILTKNVAAQQEMMEKKKRIVSRLNSINEIKIKQKQVSYHIYYLSRNLEHALWNNIQTLSCKKKRVLAEWFDLQYADKPEDFKKFINSKDIAVPGNYQETWTFIMTGLNSLHRHSNMHLCLVPYI